MELRGVPAAEKAKVAKEHLELVKKIDRNGDGKAIVLYPLKPAVTAPLGGQVDFAEFAQAYIEERMQSQAKILFQSWDTSNDGFVELEELQVRDLMRFQPELES